MKVKEFRYRTIDQKLNEQPKGIRLEISYFGSHFNASSGSLQTFGENRQAAFNLLNNAILKYLDQKINE